MGVHPAPSNAYELAHDRRSLLLAEAGYDARRVAAEGGRLARISPAERGARRRAWQEAYCRLVLLVARHGFHLEHDAGVRRWVWEQRRLHRQGLLGRRERRLLEALPGWTWEGPARRAGEYELVFAAWATALVHHLRADDDYRSAGLAQALCS